MIDPKKIKKLSKEERLQLEKLQKEYEEAGKELNAKKINGPRKEIQNRYLEAGKHLAEFLTKHQLYT